MLAPPVAAGPGATPWHLRCIYGWLAIPRSKPAPRPSARKDWC